MATQRRTAPAADKGLSPASPSAQAPSSSSSTSQPSSRQRQATPQQSSFGFVPSEAHSIISEVITLISTLPRPLIDQLAPLFDVFASESSPTSSAIHRLTTASLASFWSSTRDSLFSAGPGLALVYLLVGILTNHIRRILLPSLGLPLHPFPLTNLKLAISSPQLFLQEALSLPTWRHSAGLLLQKFAFDLLGALALALLARHRKEQSTKQHPDAPRKHTHLSPIAVDIFRVLAVVYLLTAAEYIHARAAYSLAVLVAYTKLLVPIPKSVWGLGGGGTAEHHEALREVMRGAVLLSRATHAWGVVYYVRYALGPMVIGAVGDATRGRVGLLGILAAAGWATYVLTRWSNKYYMLLEMWPMVLVIGWTVVAVGVVVREVVRGRARV